MKSQRNTFGSCDDIILNYTPILSSRRKVKLSISENAEKIRDLIKLNDHLKEEILNISEKNLITKENLNLLVKGKLTNKKKKILIKDLKERNKSIEEKNNKFKKEINLEKSKVNNLENKLNNEIKNEKEELNVLNDTIFILSNTIELKNNIIRNYKQKLKEFNYIQEKIKEIYIEKDLIETCDVFFLKLSNLFQMNLQKESKNLNKEKINVSNLIKEKEIMSSNVKMLNSKQISEKTIVWETERENENENDSDIDKSLIFKDFEFSFSEMSIVGNNNKDNLNLFYYPDKVKLFKQSKENNNSSFHSHDDDGLNNKKNFIPKLNLKQIEFNKDTNCISSNFISFSPSKSFNETITNNNVLSNSLLDEKIEEQYEKIIMMKKKISRNKKIIKKFKNFCRKCMKIYDHEFLFENDYTKTLCKNDID